MSGRSAEKIKLTSFDDLFGDGENSEPKPGKLQEIPLSLLHTFQNHPYQVQDDQWMNELAESVRQHGVLNPGLARKTEDGYELISGHRRKRASELVGRKTMPVMVKELTDDEAAILVVDSNLHRENLLPSEKAKAYRMKMEALKHQGKKEGNLTAELVGSQSRDSYRSVFRYIRLTYLEPALLELVDQKILPLTSAENLSFLETEEQEWVLRIMREKKISPNKSQSLDLKWHSEQKILTPEKVKALLDKKSEQRDIMIPMDQVLKYFPAGYTKEQIKKTIFELLDSWKSDSTE